LRNTLARLLTREGYEVSEAANGRLALQLMSQQPADVVVTDMLMPEMEGVEMILSLRRRHPGVKIIAVSGGGISSPENYLRIADALGSHKTMTKPLVPAELLAAIRSLLARPGGDESVSNR
jgi:DNA-binding response OmpR family regulator